MLPLKAKLIIAGIMLLAAISVLALSTLAMNEPLINESFVKEYAIIFLICFAIGALTKIVIHKVENKFIAGIKPVEYEYGFVGYEKYKARRNLETLEISCLIADDEKDERNWIPIDIDWSTHFSSAEKIKQN